MSIIKKKESDENEIVTVVPPTTPVVKKEVAAPPAKLITFDRYFTFLGLPEHHKEGLKAYANTKGKRTKEAWDLLLKNY